MFMKPPPHKYNDVTQHTVLGNTNESFGACHLSKYSDIKLRIDLKFTSENRGVPNNEAQTSSESSWLKPKSSLRFKRHTEARAHNRWLYLFYFLLPFYLVEIIRLYIFSDFKNTIHTNIC